MTDEPKIEVTDEKINDVVGMCNRYSINTASLILGKRDGCTVALVATNDPDDIMNAE